MDAKKNLIAVYGSLRKGCHNYYGQQLNTQVYLGNGIIKGWQLFSLGSYPAIVPSKETDEVVVEVYEVDAQTALYIDSLEGAYTKKQEQVTLPDGKTIEAAIYYLPKAEKFFVAANTGDWVQYIKEHRNAPYKEG